MQHITQNCRLKPGRVGINQHEEGRIREQERAPLQEGEDTVLDLPDFTFRPSSVGRRIHDDGVIVIAPADLPLDKFAAVIHQPADGRFSQSGELGVLSCPADHALGCIHVCDLGTRRGSRGRSAAGVGEEIQNTDIFSGADTFPDEL